MFIDWRTGAYVPNPYMPDVVLAPEPDEDEDREYINPDEIERQKADIANDERKLGF